MNNELVCLEMLSNVVFRLKHALHKVLLGFEVLWILLDSVESDLRYLPLLLYNPPVFSFFLEFILFLLSSRTQSR